ncbi:hypothetical protein CEXT_391431 [Caerostris extrusa]|uniref:Uncharacterized protein n=1 Tax=Caerostris extrusa TaxID=172846 RepID=A0AAV4UHS3_CAEEX|nr:hypothetical protein CEXT_391431 [Caerostris extrusa]
MIPVTSEVTGTTYKNYFCAVCNEDINMDQLSLWDWTLERQSNASEMHLMLALRYSPKFKSWVVMKNANILNSSRVSVSLGLPEHLASSVQFCRKCLVAKCATTGPKGLQKRSVAPTWPWCLIERGKGGSLQKPPAQYAITWRSAIFAVVDVDEKITLDSKSKKAYSKKACSVLCYAAEQ